jgi:hypothetical protein
MSFIRQLDRTELKALIQTIEPEKFIFLYDNPSEWGIFKAMSKPMDPRSIHTVVMVDECFFFEGNLVPQRPGIHTRDIEEASLPVVDTYSLIAVYDTQAEAEMVYKQASEVYAAFVDETKSQRLKFEMGLSVAIEQGRTK